MSQGVVLAYSCPSCGKNLRLAGGTIVCWNPNCADPGYTDRKMAIGLRPVSNPKREPYLGESVHYVSYGTPHGEYPSICRAAIVTEIGDPAALAVLNPAGVYFNRCQHDEGRAPGSYHFAH
jgi:hypothetical protein